MFLYYDLLLSNINNLHLTCSIVLGDFNAKCSKWCASDKNKTARIELDNITVASGDNQMIDEPLIILMLNNHFINYVTTTSIYGTLNLNIPLPLLIFEKYEIIKIQILDVSKN